MFPAQGLVDVEIEPKQSQGKFYIIRFDLGQGRIQLRQIINHSLHQPVQVLQLDDPRIWIVRQGHILKRIPRETDLEGPRKFLSWPQFVQALSKMFDHLEKLQHGQTHTCLVILRSLFKQLANFFLAVGQFFRIPNKPRPEAHRYGLSGPTTKPDIPSPTRQPGQPTRVKKDS